MAEAAAAAADKAWHARHIGDHLDEGTPALLAAKLVLEGVNGVEPLGELADDNNLTLGELDLAVT